jgi:hypothetical protein
MKKYIVFFLGIILLPCAVTYCIGFEISAPDALRPIVFEVSSQGKQKIGGILRPGEPMFKLEIGFDDVQRIRWMTKTCKVYELNMRLPGVLGWKSCYISENSINFGKSSFSFFPDFINGDYPGKLIWSK